ncbi:TPA: hypothetical protein JA361_08695 [Legionella pneumophila]|nr:hypothetical protein [Legionella pneumophila]HAT8181991.1 hypothetical protein [Legionella pneumophila]
MDIISELQRGNNTNWQNLVSALSKVQGIINETYPLPSYDSHNNPIYLTIAEQAIISAYNSGNPQNFRDTYNILKQTGFYLDTVIIKKISTLYQDSIQAEMWLNQQIANDKLADLEHGYSADKGAEDQLLEKIEQNEQSIDNINQASKADPLATHVAPPKTLDSNIPLQSGKKTLPLSDSIIGEKQPKQQSSQKNPTFLSKKESKFIEELQDYIKIRKEEANEAKCPTAHYKTLLSKLFTPFDNELKVKAAEKMILALENKNSSAIKFSYEEIKALRDSSLEVILNKFETELPPQFKRDEADESLQYINQKF